MKPNPLHWSKSAALAVIVAASQSVSGASAQNESDNNSSSSNTYDSTGTVTAISAPLTVTVKSEGRPFIYQIDPDVHVFTAARRSGTIRDVHVGQTVTVFYYKRIGLETVARVVVHETEAAGK